MINRLLYSRKVLILDIIIIYLASAYMISVFSRESIITCTAIITAGLLYLAYYSTQHRSEKEILTILTLVMLTLILGTVTGLLLGGISHIGAAFYVLTLSIALLLILYLASKHTSI